LYPSFGLVQAAEFGEVRIQLIEGSPVAAFYLVGGMSFACAVVAWWAQVPIKEETVQTDSAA